MLIITSISAEQAAGDIKSRFIEARVVPRKLFISVTENI